MIPDYTLVVAVDAKHLYQLSMTWPTWKKNKPSLLQRKMVVIYDGIEVTEQQVRGVVNHPDFITFDWSCRCAPSYGNGTDKWYNPVRYRMLASFVHVPWQLVRTPYWLKIDTDVVATGMDNWVDQEWFEKDPAIVSHPWGFTRPPEQMDLLDQWVEQHPGLYEIRKYPPLNMHPEPGRDRIHHSRIISWCAFFNTRFTKKCSEWAASFCGKGLLPVPSQDGYHFYVAKRLGMGIIRPRMKNLGWQQWSTNGNVKTHALEAMSDGIKTAEA